MPKKSVQEQIEEDISSIYLGNLNTVEFDLQLPRQGKNGSVISWKSADDRWIDGNGRVNRPDFGRGNRVVKLTGTFKLAEQTGSKTYDVRILEAENNIRVASIYPIQLKAVIGEAVYLPTAVAVAAEDGRVISHEVEWMASQPIKELEAKEKSYSGKIKGTDYPVTGTICFGEQPKTARKPEKQRQLFPLASIRLTEGTPMFEAQAQRLHYLLAIDDDQMLYNFREAAGLDKKEAPAMIGWDSPTSKLRGHTTGHYLSALALAYQSTGSEQIFSKLTYMIDELAKVQTAFAADSAIKEGFLSGYSEEQFDLLEQFAPYPDIWAPYYTLHKIFAGLLDSYRLGGINQALLIADKLGDWVYQRLSRLSHEQLQKMWGMYIAGEYGGMNESLAELYSYTGKTEHLKAAQLFDNDRLFFPLKQQVDALGGLHANQHIPQVVGALKIYEVSGEQSYYQLAQFFWQQVTNHHVYAMGGTGDGEIFQQPDNIANHISKNTAEACASYNMLKLTQQLYLLEPQAEYLAYYENVLFNHILATPDHDCGGESTYFMNTEPGAQRFFEVENSCCHGTGLENHFKYGTMLYSFDDQTVDFHFFVPSTVKDSATGVELSVMTDDWGGDTFTVAVASLGGRTLRIRKPEWAESLTFQLDGAAISAAEVNGFYLIEGSDSFQLEIKLTLCFRMVAAPDDPALFSVYYGPYLLVAENNTQEFIELSVTPETINEKMKKQKGNHYLFEDAEQLSFIPACNLGHESYHMYLKQKK